MSFFVYQKIKEGKEANKSVDEIFKIRKKRKPKKQGGFRNDLILISSIISFV